MHRFIDGFSGTLPAKGSKNEDGAAALLGALAC
jgi:hypothetical protein